MAVTIAAAWTLDVTPILADPGVGMLRLNGDLTTVTAAAFSTEDGTGADVRAMLAALTTGDTLHTQVAYGDDVYADYTVTAPAIGHGTTWVEVPLTCSAHAGDAEYLQTGQRLLVTQVIAAQAWAVGDLVYVRQAFELVPPGARALVVAASGDDVLLLFRDGTQAWFSAADQATYGVSWIGTAPAYASYVYDTDLNLHEAWRGGFFDPIWLPHPPAGAFADFARSRGAPPDTGIYEG